MIFGKRRGREYEISTGLVRDTLGAFWAVAYYLRMGTRLGLVVKDADIILLSFLALSGGHGTGLGFTRGRVRRTVTWAVDWIGLFTTL